jgi:YgiT-type zinc finger domain-containing protein
MALGDNIDPKDDVLSRLSAARAADEMPKELRCPSGHRAYRQVCRLELTVPGRDAIVHDIPVWICPQCVVGYRYSECSLPPGEEGVA